jgi:hypothetical protein
MITKPLYPILASSLAFLLATSCCWLPVLAVTFLGSAAGATAFSAGIEPFSGVLIAIGIGSGAYAGWRMYQKRKGDTDATAVVLESCITCPKCTFRQTETMPTDACQYFYECTSCHVVLKPNAGDCCVFCSFGTVECPPIQSGVSCC